MKEKEKKEFSKMCKILNQIYTEKNIWKNNIKAIKRGYGESIYKSLVKDFPHEFCFDTELKNSQDGQYCYRVNFTTGKIQYECDIASLGDVHFESVKNEFTKYLIIYIKKKLTKQQ